MYFLLNALWLVWELKYILFWLYLWQLKDYHIGRFIDHFRTLKGRKLLLDVFQMAKLLILISFFTINQHFDFLLTILTLIYLIESIIFVRAIINKTLKRPVWTFKTLLLGAVSFFVAALFVFWVNNATNSLLAKSQPWLLIEFDVLTPFLISCIVLFFQPFFVIVRKNILKRAAEKMKKLQLSGNLTVIAITGSYGKTATKEFLATILSKKFNVLKTKDHQNSEIGVAKCILGELNEKHQVFIAEVGAYNKGKVREVCSMLSPKIGILTGVNEQHLALFGTMENLLSAEGGGELADSLPATGLLVVNGSNKYCIDLYKKIERDSRPRGKIYSLNNKIVNADIWADEITVGKEAVSFVAINKAGELASFNVRVLGGHNVLNLLGAILVARELGMDLGQIDDACQYIKADQAGMVLKKQKHGINVVDSSYSANPDGVIVDLNYLSIFPQKKVIVMPCLIELGQKSGEIHEKIGKKIGEVCNLAIITTSDKFDEIKNGAVHAGMDEKNIVLCDNAKDAYSKITIFCKAGDAVLLEGRVPAELIELLSK